MDPQVLFEDPSILVVDKPAGLVVNRSQTTEGELTLQGWVERRPGFFELTEMAEARGRGDFWKRSGVVHRLDKDTSGVMVLAKNEESFVELQRQFRERQVKKVYVVLVHGRVAPREGSVALPVGRRRGDSRRFSVGLRGKRAVTRWKMLSLFAAPRVTGVRPGLYQGLSLLEVYPETGRTHQIRVHLASLGHPVVADTSYSSRKRAVADRLWCRRQFLHALRLGFHHPGDGRWMTFEAELPSDLAGVVGLLK